MYNIKDFASICHEYSTLINKDIYIGIIIISLITTTLKKALLFLLII